MNWPFFPQCRVPTNSVSLPLSVTLAIDFVLLKAPPPARATLISRSRGVKGSVLRISQRGVLPIANRQDQERSFCESHSLHRLQRFFYLRPISPPAQSLRESSSERVSAVRTCPRTPYPPPAADTPPALGNAPGFLVSLSNSNVPQNGCSFVISEPHT